MDLNKYKKIIKKIIKTTKKSFSSKKREKIKSRIILNKLEKQSSFNKRKSLKLRFDFLRLPIFFKKHYIPYFFISWFIIAILSIFIFLWPIFKVKNIEIIKKENITNMEIAYKSIEDFRWESILKIDKTKILNKMTDYQQNIKNISLNVDLPDTLKITVESYKKLFNTQINWKNYIILENWSLIPTRNIDENLKSISINTEIDKNKFISYKKMFEEEYINRISEIIRKLKENLIDIKISKLSYYEVEREIHIETEKWLILIFSLDKYDDINTQIKKLVIFNKEHKNINDSQIIYIDLRIKNKIFFCDIEEEYNCRINLKSIYK